MWESIARLVLKFRLPLLILLFSVTAFMAYHASKVQMSYDFTRTVPKDNAKSIEYEAFRKKFGEDGNLLVIGVETDKLFRFGVFSDYIALGDQLREIKGVVSVLDVPVAITLVKNDSTQKLESRRIFSAHPRSQAEIDSGRNVFLSLPFYRGLLYNPDTHVWLMAVNVSKEVMNTSGRIVTVGAIAKAAEAFGARDGLPVHISGLPLIRTKMAVKIASETTWFLLGSVLLMTIILFFFFRSFSTLLLSLGVVIIGVVFSLGTMDLFGYKITLLNALTPTLVVVIGIPNCIYFLNKYHTAFNDTGDKKKALVEMIRRMGIVTLFCNLTAAIGFGVFALTRSAILNEFGVVAGINIMLLFFISFILIPIVLSYLPPPKPRHTRYLDNKLLINILNKLELWTTHHRKLVYAITVVVLAVAVAGMFRLKSEGFIVDDLPKKDPIYTDLKFFERNFKGVMPLEIVVDTKRKKGLKANTLATMDSVDRLSQYIASQPEMARPLSLVEGLKFVRQAYYGGDSANYALPNSDIDLALIASYLQMGGHPAGTAADGAKKNALNQLLNSFVDSNQQQLRISVSMEDVGSARLPVILGALEKKSRELFDSSRYKIEFTGTSVTYLEGSSFIIKGLKDSIQWAFLLIAGCMLFLFRSLRILLCSLIPNIIPLIITAGIMGWAGVRLKPSTVIVFSIALGIAIDITIRFLVNYKQESANRKAAAGVAGGMATPVQEHPAAGPGGTDGVDPFRIVIDTIHKTGISILYTSLVLIAGFVIFCFSDFGGIQALGWLTSVTLVIATVTNLVFLPALLMSLMSPRSGRS